MSRFDGTSGRRTVAAFSLIELLVTLTLLSVMTATGATVYLQAKAKARAVQCMSNQHHITTALVAYYEDNAQFPIDTQYNDLAMALTAYIPWPTSNHNSTLPQIYKCPNDQDGSLSNSYSPYYVQRKDPTASDGFVLGCPRHRDACDAHINTIGLRGINSATAGRIAIDGVTISTEHGENSRSMQVGEMQFEDKSAARTMLATDNYRVTAVASFRLDDGRLYSVVRVNGSGHTDFSVTPGSKFEVITPVAIIGVRGTKFSVTSDNGYTRIEVTSGKVHVWDRTTQKECYLSPDEYLEIGANPTDLEDLCIACLRHCTGESHCDRCPLHVGRPERLGTTYCVECPVHSKPSKWTSSKPNDHCKKFCPLAQEDLDLLSGEIDVGDPDNVWPYW